MFKFILSIFISIVFVNPANQTNIDVMKAIFVGKFSSYTEWPESMDDEILRIQVIGDKNMAKTFQKVFRDIDANGKPVIIYSESDGYSQDFNPHIVFVTGRKNISEVIEKVQNKPVLTVTDVKDGAKKGAMINLVLIDNNIKFEINQKAMHNSPLYINYKLKNIAIRIVDPL